MSTPGNIYKFVKYEAIPLIMIQCGDAFRFIMDIDKQINVRKTYKLEITYMLFNFYIRNINNVDLEIESAVHI